MDKHFPQDMIRAAQMPGIKKCFINDAHSVNAYDCPNCGGLGSFLLFIATEGPYKSPTNPYHSNELTSHFYDGAWWIGKNHQFTCPDCQGSGIVKIKFVAAQRPTQAAMERLAEVME